MGRPRLSKDPFLLGGLVTAVGLVSLYVAPILSPDRLADLDEFVLVPLVALLVVGALVARARRAGILARRMWWCIVAAHASIVLLHVTRATAPGLAEEAPWGLVWDVAHLAFYLLMTLAAEVAPRPGLRKVEAWRRRMGATGAMVFAFGMLAYFVIVPSRVDPGAYDTLMPSYLLYIGLDLFVAIRFALLCRTGAAGLRPVFGLLATSLLCWGVLDVVEGFNVAERINIQRTSPLSLLWYLPYAGVLLASRVGIRGSLRPEITTSESPVEPLRRLVAGPIVAYALAFPIVHFGLYATGLPSTVVRGEREDLVLAMLAILGSMALVQQARSSRRRRALAEELGQAQFELRTVSHDLSNAVMAMRGASAAGRPSADGLSIDRFLNEAGSLIRGMLGEGVTYRVESSAGDDLVRVDPVQMNRVVLNLAANARDALGESGNVVVTVDRVESAPGGSPDGSAGDYVRIAFTDDGTGMSSAVLARAFEPGFTTKGAGQGSGMGLASVRSIARDAGGDAFVESAAGTGTTVSVLFPRLIPDGKRSRPTVLVVDDDPTVLEIVTGHLERAGLDVRSTSSPARAMEIAADLAGSIRLLLTDVMMPETNGVELAERLERLQPGVSVLFMSGATEATPVVRRAIAAGDGFLSKPFARDELLDALKRLGLSPAPVSRPARRPSCA